MVIVVRRLEVGAPVRRREALPHGHSVADCPLLRASRRLPQPGRHDGIGVTGAEEAEEAEDGSEQSFEDPVSLLLRVG